MNTKGGMRGELTGCVLLQPFASLQRGQTETGKLVRDTAKQVKEGESSRGRTLDEGWWKESVWGVPGERRSCFWMAMDSERLRASQRCSWWGRKGNRLLPNGCSSLNLERIVGRVLWVWGWVSFQSEYWVGCFCWVLCGVLSNLCSLAVGLFMYFFFIFLICSLLEIFAGGGVRPWGCGIHWVKGMPLDNMRGCLRCTYYGLAHPARPPRDVPRRDVARTLHLLKTIYNHPM
jgi:hypothetical protein